PPARASASACRAPGGRRTRRAPAQRGVQGRDGAAWLTQCQYKKADILSIKQRTAAPAHAGEDGESVVRIKQVQSCVAETVGTRHHGRTTLVYAGDTSWK